MKYHTKKKNVFLLMIILIIIIIGALYLFLNNKQKEGLDMKPPSQRPPFNPSTQIVTRINARYNAANPLTPITLNENDISKEIEYFINLAIEPFPNQFKLTVRCQGHIQLGYIPVRWKYNRFYTCPYANVYMSFESKLYPLIQLYDVKNKSSYLYHLDQFIKLWNNFRYSNFNQNENQKWMNSNSEKYSKLFYLFDLVRDQASINPILGITNARNIYSDLRNDVNGNYYYTRTVTNFTNLSGLINNNKILGNYTAGTIEDSLTNEITKAFANVMIQLELCYKNYTGLTCSLDIIDPSFKSDKILSRKINSIENLTYDTIYQLIRTKAMTDYSDSANDIKTPVPEKANYGTNMWIDLDIILTSYRKMTYYDINSIMNKPLYSIDIT